MNTTSNTHVTVMFSGDETREPIETPAPSTNHCSSLGQQDTPAALLCDLPNGTELFCDPSSGTAYATIMVDTHRETHRIDDETFENLLIARYYRQFKKPPHATAVKDALAAIAAKAKFDGPKLEVHLRVAEHDGRLYLDLCDPLWRCVEISIQGWRIINNPPVRFIRGGGMLALPDPVRDGSVTELKHFVNLENNDDWVLLVSWIIAAFHPRGPYPILAIDGEQGSSKSTACKIVRALIDPNECPLRAGPRKPEDLRVTASHSWMLAFDNLSEVSHAISDGLCRAATGAGIAERSLYTNNKEIRVNIRRPVILNGINQIATRPDLLDRMIRITLPTIQPGQRRTERELWEAFEEARPKILGALLDVISGALSRLPNVQIEDLPRMADFAKWATAAEPSLGWADRTFLNAYNSNINDGATLALESSPIGLAIMGLMHQLPEWKGTATELLRALRGRPEYLNWDYASWPRSPSKLRHELNRIKTDLRRNDVDVNFRKSGGRREIILTRIPEGQSVVSPQPSQASSQPEPA